MAAAAQKYRMFRCVQDLTCPGAALVQSAGIAAHVPGTSALEANARDFLLPKRLQQDFYNVDAYCRWADDLADEMGDPAESLRLLAWWRGELDAMYRGLDQSSARHPVFAALASTVAQYGIPRQPFSDLIDAFVQDQTVTRYRNWEELLAYCQNSANPVGRLVLYLCGYRDAARQGRID